MTPSDRVAEDFFWLDRAQLDGVDQHGSGEGIKVAVIDSGVDWSHPLLARIRRLDDLQVVSQSGLLRLSDNNLGDCYGHGTAVAEMIHRVAPEAEIGSFRVLGSDLTGTSEAVRVAAHHAIAKDYDVINISIGCERVDHVLKYKEWVDEAYLCGVHLVAAANHTSYRRVEWPGHFSSVISVSMSSEEGLFLRGGSLVEFATKGVDLQVAWRDGEVRTQTGSSYAAPQVAGLVARVLSRYPRLDVSQMKAVLRYLAVPLGAKSGSSDRRVEGRNSRLNRSHPHVR